MRVVEPSYLRPCLQCSGWALSSRPLRYYRLSWLLCSNSHGFRLCSAARNMLRRRSSIFSLLRQNCLSAKLAASSVATGPCSNNPMHILANNNLFHYFTMQITMHLLQFISLNSWKMLSLNHSLNHSIIQQPKKPFINSFIKTLI